MNFTSNVDVLLNTLYSTYTHPILALHPTHPKLKIVEDSCIWIFNMGTFQSIDLHKKFNKLSHPMRKYFIVIMLSVQPKAPGSSNQAKPISILMFPFYLNIWFIFLTSVKELDSSSSYGRKKKTLKTNKKIVSVANGEGWIWVKDLSLSEAHYSWWSLRKSVRKWPRSVKWGSVNRP